MNVRYRVYENLDPKGEIVVPNMCDRETLDQALSEIAPIAGLPGTAFCEYASRGIEFHDKETGRVVVIEVMGTEGE